MPGSFGSIRQSEKPRAGPPARVRMVRAQLPPPPAPASAPAPLSRRATLVGLGALASPLLLAPAARALSEPAWRADCRVEPASLEPLLHAHALRRLFPHGLPRCTDVFQGSFNDCYFLAALAAAAYRYPAWLKSHVRYVGRRPDGTRDYRVRLAWPSMQGPPHTYELCVSDALSRHGAERALWVAVFEKALAKLHAQRKVLPRAKLAGYDALRFGAVGEGIMALTGNPVELMHFATRTMPQPHDAHVAERLRELFGAPSALGFVTFNYGPRLLPGADTSAPFEVAFADGSILASADARDIMIFKRPDGRCQTLVGHHAYAVLNVTHRGDLLLYNPHGSNALAPDDAAAARRYGDHDLPGTFLLERAYIDHVLVTAYVGSIGSPPPARLAPVRLAPELHRSI